LLNKSINLKLPQTFER